MSLLDSLGQLLVKFTADTGGFTDGIDHMTEKVEGFSHTVSSVSATLATALPLAALGGEAFEAGEKFEQAAFTIRRATGAMGEELEGLEKSFSNLYASSGRSASEIAGALSQLAIRTELSGKALETLTQANLRFAKVTGTDVTQNLQQNQRLFGAWGITVADQAKKLDVLYRTSQLTGVNVALLSGTMQSQAAVLKSLGFSFNEAAALLGNLEKTGQNTDKVMAALNKGLVTLADKGVRDPEAALRTLIERMVNAKDAMSAINDGAQVFGKKGAVFLVEAMRAGGFATEELKAKLDDSQGAVDSAAVNTKSLGDRWKIFQHQLEEALVPLGKPLVSALSNAADGLKPLLGYLATGVELFTALPTPVQTAAVALAGIGVVGPLAAKAIHLVVEALSAFKIVELAGALSRLPGMIANISVAVSSGLVPALTTAETILLAVGKAIPFVAIATGIYLLLDLLNKHGVQIDVNKNKTVAAAQAQLEAQGKLLPQTYSLLTVVGEYSKELDKSGKSTDDHAKKTINLDALFKKHQETVDRISKAYAALGVESNKFRDVEASLALLAREHLRINGIVPQTTTAFSILKNELNQGRITWGQFQQAIIATGKILEKSKADKTWTVAIQPDGGSLENLTRYAHQAMDAIGQVMSQNQGKKLVEVLFGTPDDWLLVRSGMHTSALAINEVGIAAAIAAGNTSEAFKQLGVKSSAELQEMAAQARESYHTISQDAQSTTIDIQRAWLKIIEAQIAAGYQFSSATLREYERVKASTTSTIDTMKRGARQFQETWADVGRQITQTITGDLSRAFGDLLFNIGRVGEDFKRMAEDIVSIIIHKIIAQGINRAIDALSQMSGLLGKIGGFLGGVGGTSGGGGGVLGTSVGAAGGAAATIAQGVGAAGSAAGGIGGAASTAVSGTLGTVLGFAQLGVSILSGIVSGVQQAHMNSLLDLIEKSTRYSWITLGGNSESISVWMKIAGINLQQFMDYNWKVQAPLLTNIDSSMDYVTEALRVIRRAAEIQIAGGNGGGSNTYHIQPGAIVIQTNDPKAMASQLASFLKIQSPAFV